jgi:hypothetical protein
MKYLQPFFSVALLALTFTSVNYSTVQGATITVTSNADDGPGSLRQAILDANADASLDDVIIEFNIAGPGVQTITPLSRLPSITRPVTIDGYTQPGASRNTLANADNAFLRIELSGADPTGGYLGLYLTASGCTVRGLVVNRFRLSGLWAEIVNDTVIEGNFIGTDPTGTIGMGSPNGVVIAGGVGNRVGGLTPGSRNIVGGNEEGIFVQGTTAHNEVLGNFVGIGPDGATPVPNGNGVYLHYCQQVQVGGLEAGARNVISGNGNGCFINQAGGNFFQGNFIGTDVSGTLARSQSTGVAINESTNNIIGGIGAGAGNLISGSSDAGVALDGLNSRNNVVAGNLIGTDVTGTKPLGNYYYGVLFQGGSANAIGGANASARNVITASGAGVGVYGTASTNNMVLGNSIFANGIGIDLGSFSPADLGPTPNDAGDADDGANHYQNFPDISSVKVAGRNLKVEYRVDSAPGNSVYPMTVEFFIADESGQGRTFLYRTTYTTPQALDNIVFKPVVLPSLSEKIVATATDARGNTSEFCLPAAVTRNGQGGN